MRTGFIFLKRTPFIRLLLPFIAGILAEGCLQIKFTGWIILLFIFLALFSGSFLLPAFQRFRYAAVNGVIVFFIFCSLGAGIASLRDIRNNKNWIGNFYKENDALLAVLLEPLTEKENSYKALASLAAIANKRQVLKVKGRIIIYFQKDSSLAPLNYGSRVIFRKSLQVIKNQGNPGGFDYRRYCLFQNISHQVYLTRADFVVLPGKKESWFKKFLFSTREKILALLRANIHGEKEQGLAEALLIGYKDDLDKNLIQSYSNTGVVHIIAISGLHLGLIYWLLLQLMKPFKVIGNMRWLRSLLVIAALWLFSFLAGAPPSVLRSALMFTCIILGESFSRKTSIYNSLAFSAFLLLCHNPYWLWDVGFQLSYTAVLSIVIFMKPVYNLLYIKNKLLDYAWKLNAVTLSAQLLTLPVSIYYFHQFPNFFIISNFIAVPLSGIILLGEILLCAMGSIPQAAAVAGKILQSLIGWMNGYIERIDSLPFSVLEGINISIIQVFLLLLAIAALCYWLIEKQKIGLKAGMVALLAFLAVRSHSFYNKVNQRKLIVYNIPRHSAIDLIDGGSCVFVADSAFRGNDFLLDFHIKPSRIIHRVSIKEPPAVFYRSGNYLQLGSYRIIIIDSNSKFLSPVQPAKADALILSHNPRVYIHSLARIFQPGIIIFDSTNPAWKIKYWKQDCDSLGIVYHDVSEQGAVVMDLK